MIGLRQAFLIKLKFFMVIFFIFISLLLRVFYIYSNDLLVEEAYYWNYAQHLDFSYLDHPPMVAILIKTSTFFFGTNEFGVRISTIFCWFITALYSFRLTNLIAFEHPYAKTAPARTSSFKNSDKFINFLNLINQSPGKYSILLLAILPFFFISSLVITPDVPLITCWSAALYYLYRAIIRDEKKYWYASGIWLGLGMVSKYTIVLLGPATLIYLLSEPTKHFWFKRKEPYICALLVLLIFTPVIYWNATHEWASFAFQSIRRLKDNFSFSVHQYLSLIIFFLMPFGLVGFWKLLNKDSSLALSYKTKNFIKIFTLVPLLFFGLYSITHSLRFNWIGPIFLALIPWLAILIANSAKYSSKSKIISYSNNWKANSLLLIFCYTVSIFSISFGMSSAINKTLFNKFISWEKLTKNFLTLATKVEANFNITPIFVPLDLYNINSELNFYQTKFLKYNNTQKLFPILGSHIFGGRSLMYEYWEPNPDLTNNILILISSDQNYFNNPELKKRVKDLSPINLFWAEGQRNNIQIRPYYYKIVKLSLST